MRKKSDKILRWINCGIWPTSFMLSVGFTYDEIIKHCKRLKALGWHEALAESKDVINSNKHFGCALKQEVHNNKTNTTTAYYYIILRQPFDFSDWSMAALAHEVLHLCQFMLKDILDMEREYEAVAYTHTYFMEQILKALRDKKYSP